MPTLKAEFLHHHYKSLRRWRERYMYAFGLIDKAALPAVRDAPPDTVVVADGFSCKSQIEQAGTGRGALHVAQVIKTAREHGPAGYRGGRPQEPYHQVRPGPPAGLRARRLALAGAGAAAAAVAAGAAARRR
jgi:hypothetical protein